MTALIAGASVASPATWEVQPQLLCREGRSLTCELGQWDNCKQVDIGSVYLIDFPHGTYTDTFNKDMQVTVVARNHFELGKYSHDTLLLSSGESLTLYPPDDSRSPWVGYLGGGIFKKTSLTYLACTPFGD